MTLIILLFLVGLLFLAVEVIIPGGVLGTIGGLLLFGGCMFAFMDYGTSGGLVAIAVAFLLVTATLFVEFIVLPKTKTGRRAFLTKEITGVSAAFGDEARALVGKTAEAVTMLSPSGYVRIDGKRYEAFCQSGQVPAGSILNVTGFDSFRLIVSLVQNPQPRQPS